MYEEEPFSPPGGGRRAPISMEKDFDTWNEIKKKTQKETPRLYTAREIWWCQFGLNIGTEQDGSGTRFLRPAIILRGFGPDACLVVPLTKSSRNHQLRFSAGLIEGREARTNLSQIRVIDTRRLAEKVGFLDKEMFGALKKAVGEVL